MRRDKDYGWIWPVLGCFLLTAFIVWLFSIILPSIRVGDKIFNDFLTQLKNFEDWGSWVFIGIFFLFSSALIIGLSTIFSRFCRRKIKSRKIHKQGAFR